MFVCDECGKETEGYPVEGPNGGCICDGCNASIEDNWDDDWDFDDLDDEPWDDGEE